MSFPIPKLQWKNTTETGTTTISSNSITGIASTSSLFVGMVIDDAEFPTGTIITVVNANDIEVSNNATAGSTSARSYSFEFKFRFPSIVDNGEKQLPQRRVKTSISGIDQVSIDHTRFERDLEWGHLTEVEISTLRIDFFRGHANIGNEFRYFEDQDIASFFTYELADAAFEPERLGNSDKKGFSVIFKRVEL